MEKYIKVKFTEEELEALSQEAFVQNKRVNQYIHDRAVGCRADVSPLYAAFEVADKLSEVRAALNEIIRRETQADVRLYEDDVIEMDARMHNIEIAVADYLHSIRKEV